MKQIGIGPTETTDAQSRSGRIKHRIRLDSAKGKVVALAGFTFKVGYEARVFGSGGNSTLFTGRITFGNSYSIAGDGEFDRELH